MTIWYRTSLWLFFAVAACNVDSKKDSGGAPSEPQGECPAGVSIVLSDYNSTQIALSGLDGVTASPSFLSTGSGTTDGLAFALSGDVALPSVRPASGRLVLIDRYGTNVITWADPSADTNKVLGQLAVGTGFESNPSDYLEVDAQHAFVSRSGYNPTPGQQDFDASGDVLVVDTDSYQIVGDIVIPPTDDLPPRPSSMLRLGDRVLVTLDRNSEDFQTTGDVELAVLSVPNQSLEFKLGFPGLKSCGRLALSPNGKQLALACTGAIGLDGNVEDVSQSALLLLDPSSTPPHEVKRFAALDLVGGPLQREVVFASDSLLLLKTQTPYRGEGNNRWLALDLESETTTTLLEAAPDAMGLGQGLVYGSMFCAPGCSKTCLLSDADRGMLARAELQDPTHLTLVDPLFVDPDQQALLPPRDLCAR